MCGVVFLLYCFLVPKTLALMGLIKCENFLIMRKKSIRQIYKFQNIVKYTISTMPEKSIHSLIYFTT